MAQVVRVEVGSPLPERVAALLRRPAPTKNHRTETISADDPVDPNVMRKRIQLDDSDCLTIRSGSRSQRDEFLVAYQKHRRRAVHVWEIKCSEHHSNTIQGLVRVEVVREQTPGTIYMSGLTFAINVRRTPSGEEYPPRSAASIPSRGSHYLIILDTLSNESTIGWARNGRLVAHERYHGDDLSFYLFLLEIEVFGDYEVVTQYLGACYEPLTLEQLSRLSIRQQLEELKRLNDVALLPLPTLLKDFIEQPDKLSDQVP